MLVGDKPSLPSKIDNQATEIITTQLFPVKKPEEIKELCIVQPKPQTIEKTEPPTIKKYQPSHPNPIPSTPTIETVSKPPQSSLPANPRPNSSMMSVFVGKWGASRTYMLNEVVFDASSRTTYRCLMSDNKNIAPASNQLAWQECGHSDGGNDEEDEARPVDQANEAKIGFEPLGSEAKAILDQKSKALQENLLSKRQKRNRQKQAKKLDARTEEQKQKQQELLESRMFEDPRTKEEKEAQMKALKKKSKQARALKRLPQMGSKLVSSMAGSIGSSLQSGENPSGVLDQMQKLVPKSGRSALNKLVPTAINKATQFMNKNKNTQTSTRTPDGPQPPSTVVPDTRLKPPEPLRIASATPKS
jgi:Skp family chaperone for outer membrane proteins